MVDKLPTSTGELRISEPSTVCPGVFYARVLPCIYMYYKFKPNEQWSKPQTRGYKTYYHRFYPL